MGIGIEYYAFALFVAGLVCVIAVICKVLFSNLKRQKKMLDERESQILQLYTSVETLMEEFSDQVKLTTDEIKAYEYRETSRMTAFDLPPELENKEQVLERLPRTLPFDANRIRAAGEVLERAERIVKSEPTINRSYDQTGTQASLEKPNNGAVFQRFFEDSAETPPPPAEKTNTHSRTSIILTLAREGKTDIEIASQLGITRNEVQLVTSLLG